MSTKAMVNTLPTHESLLAQIKSAPITRISGRLKMALKTWERCAQHIDVAKRHFDEYKSWHAQHDKKEKAPAKKKKK